VAAANDIEEATFVRQADDIEGNERMDGEPPFYLPVGNEMAVFDAAWRSQLAILIKGPTGCGKTRFVEHMAHRLGVALHTVSCHEDLTSSDLLGRYVLTGGDTVWIDGPLTRAAKEGAICYLDEIVEARQDSVVAIHPLADHRRELSLDRLGGVSIPAEKGFSLVVSFNPGYQSVLKDLKPSTRQRMVAIDLGFPPPEVERAVVAHEASVDESVADDLVRLAQAIRRVEDSALREVASTRTLIAAGSLIACGLSPVEAAVAGIAGPLTDDPALSAALVDLVGTYLGG
jgi:nitric oxide reductase NorQ protein